ncbi:desulfoferrodoxin family protein [uncultured Slackia sp.]|uniref:desulfoferrodoxin family protein n=1 Tax=uncultured Slackia sp. TaxID=665903 RepID=UPI0026E042FA|nr:desulfoferrodoxin family protein [uncultured Slackia sp.]
MDIKFFKCEHCGNIVIKVVDAGVPVMCCGEKMVELVAGSVDAAVEKHVPVVEVEGANVRVKVGEVEHPMTEEHLIQFVVLVTEKGYQVAQLTAENEPKAEFVLAEGDAAVKVYEYCNLHGLWVNEL